LVVCNTKMSGAWKDGLYSYTVDGKVVITVNIKGEVGEFAPIVANTEGTHVQLMCGQFTNADKRGLTLTGKEEYNFQMIRIDDGKNEKPSHGVVNEDGTMITMMNGHIVELMDEETIKRMEEEKDPADNPSNNYTPQPENMGKFLWISGLSGMGKTTTAKLLQDKEGFVNYEGDCFMMGLNPYVGASKKGNSYFGTRPLSGISMERQNICRLGFEEGYKLAFQGQPVDPKIWSDFYNLLCDDILKERSKLGGDWVIGQAVYSKAAREVIRNKLGEDLTIVVLESGEEDIQVERMAKRCLGSGEISEEAREEFKASCAKYVGGHEHVEDDELLTFAIYVTKAMTPEDVAKQALDLLQH